MAGMGIFADHTEGNSLHQKLATKSPYRESDAMYFVCFSVATESVV
jgi:hypothetical protein